MVGQGQKSVVHKGSHVDATPPISTFLGAAPPQGIHFVLQCGVFPNGPLGNEWGGGGV